MPESAIRYSVFDSCKKHLSEKDINKNLNYFISGSLSGITGSCAVYPLETVRTKITAQSNKNMYNGFRLYKKSYERRIEDFIKVMFYIHLDKYSIRGQIF